MSNHTLAVSEETNELIEDIQEQYKYPPDKKQLIHEAVENLADDRLDSKQ